MGIMMRLVNLTILIPLFIYSICSTYASLPKIEISTIGIPPYGINEQGKLSGLYYDLTNLIASNAGYTANNKIAPYARIIKSLKFGTTDLTIMFRYPELEGYVDYIGSLPSKPLVVIGLQGQDFKDINSLSGKTIIYLRGAKFNKQIDEDKTIGKHLVSDYILGVKMLVARRADAIIGSLQSIQRTVLELEIINNEKIFLGKPLIIDSRTPWIQVSKKHSSHLNIEDLKQSFLKLEADGVFNTLKAKYTIY